MYRFYRDVWGLLAPIYNGKQLATTENLMEEGLRPCFRLVRARFALTSDRL